MNKISNQPPKGTSDWTPEEFRVRKYIFDTWRSVCMKFGYQEYLTPIVENAEVYRAKSGEDVGGKELMSFFDRGERELAIRPEMTPSVTRMVSKFYESAPKPIRLFSIANFFRNEKPQRGRNREFWQLNCDIFGSESVNADIEILSLAIEIMKSFGAEDKQFVVLMNDRRVIQGFLNKYLKISDENISVAIRILDKFWKIPNEELLSRLKIETGAVIENEDFLLDFMKGEPAAVSQVIKEYAPEEARNDIEKITETMISMGYGDYGKFDGSLMRGLDYYDGIVFEVFDYRYYEKRSGLQNSESENAIERSLFGGGRYNGLASIFGSKSFPAVGFAPGDETTKLFLESWNLLPQNLKEEVYYLPLLSNDLLVEVNKLATSLRSEGKNIMIGLETQTISKALELANKKGCDKVILYGENEKSRGEYLVKDMQSGEQSVFKLPI